MPKQKVCVERLTHPNQDVMLYRTIYRFPNGCIWHFYDSGNKGWFHENIDDFIEDCSFVGFNITKQEFEIDTIEYWHQGLACQHLIMSLTSIGRYGRRNWKPGLVKFLSMFPALIDVAVYGLYIEELAIATTQCNEYELSFDESQLNLNSYPHISNIASEVKRYINREN